MKFKKTILMTALSLALCGCSTQQPKEQGNPFFSEFNTPHGIAPFADITIEHYREGMLKGMEEQEQALMQLFIGTTVTETTTHTYQVIPDSETERALLGRFSRKLGLLHKDDLAGAPIYIDITNKNTVPAPAPEPEATDKKAKLKGKKNNTKQDGLVYNLPGKADIKVYSNNTVFAEECLSLSQFGNTETLSSALFSKKKDIKVTLDPHTGALLRIEE